MVAAQIQNGDSSVPFQNAPSLGESLFGVHGVMQCLAEERQVHGAAAYRNVFQIAQPVFQV